MGIRFPEPEERMALAKRQGVKVVVGTDCGGKTCGNFGNHGIDLLMPAQCGFTNTETIVAATGLAAEAMRLTEVTGSRKPGLAADVLILDRNPLEDISVLPPKNSRIETVIKGGKIVHRDLQEEVS
jgi:imidazolonepropionase-like amidohydrolase